MKRITVFLVLLMMSTLLVGCGTTMMAYNNVQKIKKKNATRLNLQSTPPDLKPLEQYAQTPLAKKLFYYIDGVSSNPDAIPAKYMDPATNPEAAAQYEKDIALARRGLMKSAKQSGMNKAMLAQMIKSTEEDLKRPYWEVADLPEGASIGIIREIQGNTTQYLSRKTSKYLYFMFPMDTANPGKVKEDIKAAIDSFLLQSDKWTKTDNLVKQSNEDAIETMKDTIALQKKQLEDYGDNPKMKDYTDRVKRDLEKNENMLAYFEKKRDSADNSDDAITFYKYSWSTKSGNIGPKNMPSTFSVVVKNEDGSIILNMMKMEYE
ncbi:MAG: hypothetical protein AB7E76_09570 [Deferribacterales bacterium]